jgi:hypothetical protein
MTAQAPTRSKPSLGPVALKGFFRIAELWKLRNEQQMKLLNVPESTFFKYKKHQNANISGDTLERISYVLGIYKDLRILFPHKEAAHNWVHQPNKAAIFGGAPAIDRMTAGRVSDLFIVRQYLDAQVRG